MRLKFLALKLTLKHKDVTVQLLIVLEDHLIDLQGMVLFTYVLYLQLVGEQIIPIHLKGLFLALRVV